LVKGETQASRRFRGSELKSHKTAKVSRAEELIEQRRYPANEHHPDSDERGRDETSTIFAS
jgi:hypothetical protein